MSAVDEKGRHLCSSVPSVEGGTAEHGQETRNSAETGAEQSNLQALALKALKRNAERNSDGTDVFHHPHEEGSDVPPSFPNRMPDPRKLGTVCRRAVHDYPEVDVERLRRFLEVAEDPAWCKERIARQLARRMAEGMIR